MKTRPELVSLAAILALSLSGTGLNGDDTQAKSQKMDIFEEQTPMRIDFLRTGGYPAGKWRCDIDTQKLPELENRKLHTLIEGSGILSVKNQTFINQNERNEYLYKLRVRTAKDTHQLTIDESSLPLSFGPLIEYLERHSVQLSK